MGDVNTAVMEKVLAIGGQQFMGYMAEKLQGPSEVHLESDSRCNARCVMCPREGMERYQGPMARKLFDRAVDQVKAFPTVELLHFHLNGEPLLLGADELVRRLDYARRWLQRPRLLFFTNASLLDEYFTHALLDSALDEIAFSVDGGDKLSYERVRVGLQWEKVIGNIKFFVEENIKRGRRIKTHAFIVPQKGNEGTIEAFHTLFRDMGVDDVGGSGVQNIGGLVDSKALKLKEQYDKGDKRMPCWRIFVDIDVLADGRVPVCCQDVRGLHILGDIKKQTLEAIWHGEAMANVRLSHLGRLQEQIEFCSACDYMESFVAPEWWPR